MKKTNKLFIMMLVAGSFAMLFSSCNKDKNVKEVVINLPEFVEEGEEKAYIDFFSGNKFKWNANDQVVVYNLALDGTTSEKAIYACGANAGGKITANFEYASGTELTDKQYGYFMYYPVDNVVNDWNQNADMPNYQYFIVPGEQKYTLDINGNPTLDPTSMSLAVELSDLTSAVQLKSIFGVLKLKLKGSGNVKKIEVIDSRFNLQGRVAMKLHEVKMDRFTTAQNYFIAVDDPYSNDAFLNYWNTYSHDLGYHTEGEGHMMTLKCDNGVALDTRSDTPFFIGLRPGALKYGFTIKVYLDGESTPHVLDYTGVNNLHYGIKAGVVKVISATL